MNLSNVLHRVGGLAPGLLRAAESAVKDAPAIVSQIQSGVSELARRGPAILSELPPRNAMLALAADVVGDKAINALTETATGLASGAGSMGGGAAQLLHGLGRGDIREAVGGAARIAQGGAGLAQAAGQGAAAMIDLGAGSVEGTLTAANAGLDQVLHGLVDARVLDRNVARAIEYAADKGTDVAKGVGASLAASANDVAGGGSRVLHGLATANPLEVLSGAMSAGNGGLNLAAAATPAGAAALLADSALGVALDTVAGG